MKTKIKYILGVFFVLILTIISCTEETYTLGDLTAPSNVILNAEILGQDANHPNGDGSGDVIFTITGEDILGAKIDYDASDALELVNVPTGVIAKKYTKLGLNTYRVTVVAYGAGGTSTNVTKDISVRSDFTPDPAIITNITNDASKTWIVDKSVSGHFGVGPWNPTSVTPAWWAAGINEKVNCCNCFYTSTFTFAKIAATGTFTLTVASPDGAFTKTGALAGGLPGIPASGAEGCYAYAGGTSAFSFVPSSSGVAASAPSTKTAIQLAGVNTYIGYGSLLKEYEIMVSTPTYMYLRIQGTETGNAWYLKMIPKP
ncbi:MAG: hypothetical protein APF83_00310 [Lutibacter sp. BRH_c52]|nr:MAG: hypothetical protein APF83_00310 [Lutibacter sp. BRH_c52]